MKHYLSAIVFLLCAISMSHAQEDPQASFLLRLDGNTTSTIGERPTEEAVALYNAGILDQGAVLRTGDKLRYATRDKINLLQGTIEFWIKPQWSPNDQAKHYFYTLSASTPSLNQHILFYRETNNSLQCQLRYSASSWFSLQYAVGADWGADKWHHLAVTWKLPGKVTMYVDGYAVKSQATTVTSLYWGSPGSMFIGQQNTADGADAVFDEFRIRKHERSAKEIAMSFASPLHVTSLSPKSNPIQLFRDWNVDVPLIAQTQIGTVRLPLAASNAASRNRVVAIVTGEGRLQGEAPGNTMIGVQLNEAVTTITVHVRAPARPHEIDDLPPFLKNPVSDRIYTVPVMIIKYLPTIDGINVDAATANYPSTLDALNSRLTTEAIRTKFMLEEGSRFHGYKDPTAKPSIGYRVVRSVTIYENVPPGIQTNVLDVYFPDYHLILDRVGGRNLVENLGVKEFWVWTYHNRNIVPTESNMSSPTTGDISNSNGDNTDMPIYNRTFTLYNFNFAAGSNNAVHNHGHQFESILSYVNQLQDGNTDLFWKKFVANDRFHTDPPQTGRCGWTHSPPNTTEEYIYADPASVESDIETWTPAGGQLKFVTADTWANIPYQWVPGTRPGPEQIVEAQWYIYWMQNMPGRDNTIPNGGATMTNWWAFTGDWDGSLNSGLGLYTNSAFNQRRSKPAPKSFKRKPLPNNWESQPRP
jgi:Concanavalin A-like lectin/glucanases superfamily